MKSRRSLKAMIATAYCGVIHYEARRNSDDSQNETMDDYAALNLARTESRGESE